MRHNNNVSFMVWSTSRDHKYVMHSGRSTIAGFTVAVAKQFTPLRDASGRPLFQVPLTHAQQIQRGSGH